jgi:hypothetical protein
MPDIVRIDILSKWQIIKARGKAAIIALVKYLKAMGINPVVIHDEDKGVKKAEIFNNPILAAVGDESRRFMLKNCLEDVLGYSPPRTDKPYHAYIFINTTWGEHWDGVSTAWKEVMEKVFAESFIMLPHVKTQNGENLP